MNSTKESITLSFSNQCSQLGSKLPISAMLFQLLIRWSGSNLHLSNLHFLSLISAALFFGWGRY
ncbi:hypothetical protein LINPERHAP1_LOCUS37445 [Linum perenne]